MVLVFLLMWLSVHRKVSKLIWRSLSLTKGYSDIVGVKFFSLFQIMVLARNQYWLGRLRVENFMLQIVQRWRRCVRRTASRVIALHTMSLVILRSTVPLVLQINPLMALHV
ncbi:hypothetical protein C4K68_16555 [Pokkaliibacter plantistimulans]|uniref:Uncharacterized protein n=1 Tax=Proteobacteria bacterium 228 TaxID=2083153 RepID=A0A2S5KN22_9PROT|nr:hypothetical protein C4K68_16555 [Pokkaliibacter plantistimulans]